ncbi:MAG: hypothetical protein AAF585_27775 [Verrucomicrobiota bacterium]
MKSKTCSQWIAIFAMLTPMCLLAETRTFTSTDGKEIIAELTGVIAGKVQLKIDGKKYAVPMERLIAEDQTFIKKWAENNITYHFRIYPVERDGLPNGQIQTAATGLRTLRVPRPELLGNEEGKVSNKHYLVDVSNNSSADLQGIDVEYRIFVRQRRPASSTSREGVVDVYQLGDAVTVKEIPVGKKATLTTRPVGLIDSRSQHERVTTTTTTYDDGSTSSSTTRKTINKRVDEDIAGIWVRVKHKGRVVAEYKDIDDNIVKDDPQWANQSQHASTAAGVRR